MWVIRKGEILYIRRPLFIFSLLFALILAVILSIAGGGCPDTATGKDVSIRGRICKIEDKNDRFILHVKCKSPSDNSYKVLVYLKDHGNIIDRLHIGSHVKVNGRAEEFESASNRGQFDLRAYYMRRGYAYAVYDAALSGASADYDHIADALYRIKEGTKRVYGYYFDDSECGVMDSLILADRNSLTPELKDQYRIAGISHILALSGLHIVSLGFAILKMLRRIKLPMPVCAFVSATIIGAYCIMAGMPVSALRAFIMFLLSVGALLIGRTPDIRTSAAVAALILLATDPEHIFDASFLLSFSAIMGIGLVYPSIRDIVQFILNKARIMELKRSDKKAVRAGMAILSTLLFSVSIQLAIIPFTMWFYYEIPAYGIIVNLIVVPLAGVLLMSGFAVGILGYCVLYAAGTGGILDTVVSGAAKVTKIILAIYDYLTETVSTLPGALIITGRPKLWQMIAYYLMLVCVVAGGMVLAGRERKMLGPKKHHRKGDAPEIRGIAERNREAVRYLRIRSLILLCICLAGSIILFLRFRADFEISALYVGQGQCFIMHGRDIPTVMYDCGSTDEKKAGKYMVEPFLKYCGINRIDTVIISHLDTDHVSALIELLEDKHAGIRIDRIIISGSRVQKESDNYPVLLEAASLKGISVHKMVEGDKIKWKRMAAKCLSPDREGEATDLDINEGSLVLAVEYRKNTDDIFRMLFTGDIGCETEEELVRKGIGTFDYLQAAHHGSRTAANADFLKCVSPRIAVISAGRNNRYGHPHAETIALLNADKRIHTYITSRDGEVSVRKMDFYAGKWNVVIHDR